MKTPARPEFYLSPANRTWVVMTYYNQKRILGAWWPEVADGEDIPPEINQRRCDMLHTSILRGQSSDPTIHNEDDHVALMRVAEDDEGYPRLLMACLSLDVMRSSGWMVKRPSFALDDPSRTYTIEGDTARVDQMHPSFAVMRWCFDIEGSPRREWTFPLWRWQLCLAALQPVSFEMMADTHDATEAEL